MTVDEFLKLAGGSSALVVCLVIAVKFLFAEKNKAESKLEAEREKRILGIEEQNSRCAEDRVTLHKEVARLNLELAEMRKQMFSLYSSMLKHRGNSIAGEEQNNTSNETDTEGS